MNDKKGNTIKINRRGFIQSSIAAFFGLGVTERKSLCEINSDNLTHEFQAEKPRIKEFRSLGRTGFKVSDIGFGAVNKLLEKSVCISGTKT